MENSLPSQNSYQHRLTPRPVEVITLLYTWVSGLYLIAGASQVPAFWFHLLARIGITLGILGLVWLVPGRRPVWLRPVRDFLPLLLIGFFYNETGDLNNILLPDQDPLISGLDQWLFGTQPSIVFSSQIAYPWFNELMYAGYFSYFVLIIGFLLSLYFRDRKAYEYNLFIIISSFYLYYLIFCVFPVTGPQYYFPPPDSEVPATYLFSHLVKWIQSLGEAPTGAFPSSHVGVAMILLFLMHRRYQGWFRAALPISVLLVMSTVYIKAHYLSDVLAGLLSFPLILFLVKKIYQFFRDKKLSY